jgi:hypothetical protein
MKPNFTVRQGTLDGTIINCEVAPLLRGNLLLRVMSRRRN